jgi:hypothetical protein
MSAHERIQTPNELLLKHLRRIHERAFIAQRDCPDCKQLERAGLIEFPDPLLTDKGRAVLLAHPEGTLLGLGSEGSGR